MAQAYNHVIFLLPQNVIKLLKSSGELRILNTDLVILLGMWLPETAVDLETLAFLADNQIQFTMLAPWQIEDHEKLALINLIWLNFRVIVSP